MDNLRKLKFSVLVRKAYTMNIVKATKIVSLLIFVLLFKTSSAQNFTPFFKDLNVQNGLSHKKINCVLQDKRGFMWFGTEDGLSRYDGRYFTVYRSESNKTTCLSGNIISDLYEDNDAIIWVATSDGGLTKYDYRLPPSQQFKQFRHDNHDVKSIPENGISKIKEDNYGNLWLATSSNYVVRFNKKTEIFDVPVKQGTKAILSLAIGSNGVLLVGRAGGGLLKIDTHNLSYQEDKRYQNLYANLPHASICAIYKDKQNTLWLGSWDNVVYHYSFKNNLQTAYTPIKQIAGMPEDEILSFAEDNQRQIWMAGKNTGITIYNYVTHQVFNLRHNPLKEGTIADDHVNAVYIDHNGIVWVGTNNGLSMYSQLFSPFKQFILPAEHGNITIYDFFKDSNRLWIATSDGIYIKKDGSNSFDHKELIYKGEKLSITKFFRDVDKTLYIGTDYTLFTYQETNNAITPLLNTEADPVMKKLVSSRIVSIVRDTINNHPVLLVSPYGHFITYYDLQDKRWISRADSSQKILKKYNVKDNLIRKFYTDNKGDVWLATFKFGLGIWQQNNSPIKYYNADFKDKNSLSNNNVYDIIEDKNDNFWVSTYGGGINYFNKQQNNFEHIKESSNLTEGMESDRHGNLWMLCNGHIHKYDPPAKIYSCYDLPNLQSTGGVKGYIYKDNQNNLYAAGINYYITFNPDKVANIIHEPEVYFTDFKVFDSSMSHLLNKKTIKLKHSQNFFSIEFSAPEYSGDNLYYSYMLEGIDKTWREANKQNIASYTNLSGGTYHFKVKASNWKNSLTTTYKSIDIVITPPFWLQWWFYGVLFIIVSAAVYSFYRYRVQIILERQSVRNGIAQDLHDQIGSTLSSISVYSEVAKIYRKQKDAHELNSVLDTIASTANNMIFEMADIVWAINPKNDHLQSIVARIESFAQPLCNIKNIKLNTLANTKSCGNVATMQVRKNVYLILKEAVNNAIKHANCKIIWVDIKVENKMMFLLVKDDGVGFDVDNLAEKSAHSLTGNGLENIKQRANALKANFKIDSTPGSGTCIKLSFVL
jgi:ligand-binding sensor domain-containing protein